MDNEQPEITEMHDLKVKRQDGVGTAASGFRFLVKKSVAIYPSGSCECCADCKGAETSESPGCDCCENCTIGHEIATKDVNAVGGIDENPDINKAEFVIRLLAQLIEAEAREAAVGAHEECDIQTLSEAMSLMKWFLHSEQYGAEEDDGNFMKEVAEEFVVCKAHRKFSSDERKSLASEGKALPDGSYPIPDADALHRAAILARSGHGDVAAAKRLIAKRARELKVPNPLSEHEDAQKGVEDATVIDPSPETSEAVDAAKDVDTFSKEDVSKMIADALAETVEVVTKERDAARDELAVLKATPIPGGPVITATAGDNALKNKSQAVSKAIYYRNLAKTPALDRDLVVEYSKRAAEFEAAAR